MKLGISYKDFLKNPIIAILSVIGLGYLYVDNKGVYKETIVRHEKEIANLKNDLELTNELPEGRLNWLIENTPVVNKRIKQGK